MKHLKELLRRKGKTQRQLADALSRDKSAVTLLLQGKRQLKAAEILVIAEFLDITQAEVLGLNAPPQAPTPAQEEPALIPIAGRVSERLAVSDYVLRKEKDFFYQGAPLPASHCFMLEVADESLNLCGLLPNDLVLCDPKAACHKHDIVLVKQTLPNGREIGLLRNYQPPFLEPASTRSGFDRLHEERAGVVIIAKIIEVIRHYQ